jgi:hypothetical protein
MTMTANADSFVLLVMDRLSQDLPIGTPPNRNIALALITDL